MKKILVLEDNLDAAEIITTVLNDEGLECILCHDSITAFLAEKNFSDDISLVIFDIKLPKDDGITVVEQMKKISPNQKFLCISAYSDDYVGELSEIGVDEILQKPFQMEELIEAVKNLVA